MGQVITKFCKSSSFSTTFWHLKNVEQYVGRFCAHTLRAAQDNEKRLVNEPARML